MNSMTYVPDIEKWKKHFRDQAMGKTRPNAHGYYVVGDVQKGGEDDAMKQRIRVVTPVAQAVELAKSELNDSEELFRGKGPTKKVNQKKSPTKKVSHPNYLENTIFNKNAKHKGSIW